MTAPAPSLVGPSSITPRPTTASRNRSATQAPVPAAASFRKNDSRVHAGGAVIVPRVVAKTSKRREHQHRQGDSSVMRMAYLETMNRGCPSSSTVSLGERHLYASRHPFVPNVTRRLLPLTFVAIALPG